MLLLAFCLHTASERETWAEFDQPGLSDMISNGQIQYLHNKSHVSLVPQPVWQAFEERNLTPCTVLTGHQKIPAAPGVSFAFLVKVVSVTHVMIANYTSPCGKSPLSPSSKGSGGISIIQMNTCNFEGRHTFCIGDSSWCSPQWKHFISFNIYWLCFQDSCSAWISAYSWDYPHGGWS